MARGEKLQPLEPFRTGTPPVIDGVLDDAVWTQAPSETGFQTWRPDFGKEMQQKTVVYYAYDRENLYFAYRCYDRDPSKIKASVTARDTINEDDLVCLNLDTFNDQQSLCALYVNPLQRALRDLQYLRPAPDPAPEHDAHHQRMMTDLLASFTYIPGTVVHIGYGSLYEKIEWREGEYEPSDRFLETQRSFFFKVSYLWRL
jgi:hypothetical protein